MKRGGDSRFFSRRRNRGWRQRKWKKEKEKGRWTEKMGTGKEVQRGT
jgi:hypothetical protein